MGTPGTVDDGRSASEQAGGASRRALSVETRALLWLTVGAVVFPFIGPAIGLWGRCRVEAVDATLPFVPLGGIVAAAYLVASSWLVLAVFRKS